ncbi:TPA: hypothetical protein HA338_16060 [Methanosarcina acetivorans]|uniref:Uncharacterized protein n=1 Tax=Methanosarcina acetivorans TaxID=2214 RepID=A0A832SLR8_9EURY|nr:hypothetical protein [Methanosarcina acetivorans]HIH95470.1 hypothetical protein [Methanosarcina acetivorans]
MFAFAELVFVLKVLSLSNKKEVFIGECTVEINNSTKEMKSGRRLFPG